VKISPTPVFYFLLFTFAIGISCGSKPADLRTFIPADSLVYLESNDLGAVMKTITERPAFREAAKTVPDFSALNGVKMAVAVTGFESKEIPVTNENAVLSFQPHFVAILETNAWNFQALSFTENKLGEFINQVYGGEISLETSDKNDGKYFVWTARDGRKAFALVQGSVVFFGNDETAIEKSLAVKRGETDSIAKNPKITNADRLAFGYVSLDGVGQIANLIGVKYASETSEVPEVQSAIAEFLPQLLRGIVTEIVWTCSSGQAGIQDVYSIGLKPEAASVFAETMAPGKDPDNDLKRLTPRSVTSTTRYNLRDARVAWRSVLLVVDRALGGSRGELVRSFGNNLLEPYGIRDAELFLASVYNTLQTFDLGKESSVGVASRIRDEAGLKRSVIKEIDFAKTPETITNTAVWRSVDREFSTAILGHVAVGSTDVVDLCIRAENEGEQLAFADQARIWASNAPIVTFARNVDEEAKIVEILAEAKSETTSLNTESLTETLFNGSGVERRTVSDFGIIGWMITHFASEK
jgi:hypothetical protein